MYRCIIMNSDSNSYKAVLLYYCKMTLHMAVLCRGFYLHAIKKDGSDLCATKKIARTYVPSS
jgi:hypothetical protein